MSTAIGFSVSIGVIDLIPWYPGRAAAAVAALALAVGGVNPVVAQVRDRRGAESFPDSIALLPAGEPLRALERDLMVRAKRDRANPTLHYRLGFLASRFREWSDAAAEFKTATQLDPQWGAAWFWLGQAELELGEAADTTQLGRRALLARDAWNRAAAAFSRATALDPTWAFAAVRSVETRGPTPASAVIRNGLRQAVTGGSRPAGSVAALALGRIERILGDTTAALVAFDLAATLPGGRAMAALESARTRLTRGDPRGRDDYFLAASLDDSTMRQSLRSDLAWIATADELNAFDQAKTADLVTLLQRFWQVRDRADLRNDGERLREHYRRLAVGGQLYRNPDDQRKAVLVRHGEPDNRAVARLSGIVPNESWRYRRAEGDLFVHFVAAGDTTNYRVGESIFDAVPDREATGAADERSVAADPIDVILRSRAQLAPFFQSAVASRRDQLTAFRIREREVGRAGRNLALTTDRFPLVFPRDLAGQASIHTSADATGGRIIIAFALPQFAFDSTQVASDRYRVRIRAAVWHSTDAALATDTILSLAPPGPTAPITGTVILPVPIGIHAVRAVIEAGGARGMTVSRDLVGIVGPDAPLTVTDVVLGVAGQPVAAGISGPIDPRAEFSRNDTVVASGALMGSLPGGRLRARVLLRPAAAIARDGKWRSFPGAGEWLALPSGSRQFALRLPVKGVKAGRYELELEVEGEGVGVVRSRTTMTVVSPPGG